MTEPRADLEPALLAKIACELATEAYTLEQIYQRYKLDREYFDSHIRTNQFYQRVYEDYVREWRSIESATKRIAFYAQASLEEKLPSLAARMGDSRSDFADAVAAAKLFRELAGIASPSSQQSIGSGERFAISINFSNHKVALTTEAQTVRGPNSTITAEEGGIHANLLAHVDGAATHSEPRNTTDKRPPKSEHPNKEIVELAPPPDREVSRDSAKVPKD